MLTALFAADNRDVLAVLAFMVVVCLLGAFGLPAADALDERDRLSLIDEIEDKENQK